MVGSRSVGLDPYPFVLLNPILLLNLILSCLAASRRSGSGARSPPEWSAAT
jgi:hypothetical protein